MAANVRLTTDKLRSAGIDFIIVYKDGHGIRI
jgi:hypothetical protein